MALERPRFTTTKLREGYDMGDVDAAIDRIFGALAEPVSPMSTEDVRSLRFTPVRLREGYDMDQVDTWLDGVVAELRRREAGQPSGAVLPEPVADGAPTAYAPTQSEAIVEVGSRSNPTRWLVVLVVLVAVAVLVYASFA